METIKQVLIRRDGLTPEEADDQIAEAKQHLKELLEAGNMMEAEDICQEHFGLEPDYIFDLM